VAEITDRGVAADDHLEVAAAPAHAAAAHGRRSDDRTVDEALHVAERRIAVDGAARERGVCVGAASAIA